MIGVMQRMWRGLGAIALLAVLVRAVVPAGYMLATAETPEGRYLTVMLCEGHEGPQQVIDLDTGLPVDPSVLDTRDDGREPASDAPPCVFAGAAHLAQPVDAGEPVEFAASEQVVFAAVRDVRPGRGIAAPPPPSTGPPQLF